VNGATPNGSNFEIQPFVKTTIFKKVSKDHKNKIKLHYQSHPPPQSGRPLRSMQKPRTHHATPLNVRIGYL